jgi:Uma2 family endonuclease
MESLADIPYTLTEADLPGLEYVSEFNIGKCNIGDLKFEIIRGQKQVVAPAFIEHNTVGSNIAAIFKHFLWDNNIDAVAQNDNTYVVLGDYICVPDFLFVLDKSKIIDHKVVGAPDIIAEVLSKSTEKHDKQFKKIQYEKNGVQEYWLVSYTEKTVETYLLTDGVYVLDEIYQIPPQNISADELPLYKTRITRQVCGKTLTIDLDRVFG